MKSKTYSHAMFLVLSSTLLMACQKEPDTPAKIEPKHPWDWVPEDVALAKGREIYMAECSLCHNEGEEGAPALTAEAKWAPRIEKGLPTLIENAINGFNGPDGEMPARGGSDYLTDEQMAGAVKYMIEATKK